MALQIGLYRTVNDLKLYIPVRYEIKIISTTEMKFLCTEILFEFILSSKIANK